MTEEMNEMAYVTSHRSASFRLSDVVAQVMGRLTDAIQRRKVYAETLAELSALSDRDLADLGVSRFNIEDIARAAAYGK